MGESANGRSLLSLTQEEHLSVWLDEQVLHEPNR
jgi:hypothetical protein